METINRFHLLKTDAAKAAVEAAANKAPQGVTVRVVKESADSVEIRYQEGPKLSVRSKYKPEGLKVTDTGSYTLPITAKAAKGKKAKADIAGDSEQAE